MSISIYESQLLKIEEKYDYGIGLAEQVHIVYILFMVAYHMEISTTGPV